jgi:hypothetical protein
MEKSLIFFLCSIKILNQAQQGCAIKPRELALTFAHVGFDFDCRLAIFVLAFYAHERVMSERLGSPYHRLTRVMSVMA